MKRIVDIFGAVAGLFIFSPFFVIISFIIRYKMGHPILFRQIRPGLNGKPFTLIKFRTMDEFDKQNSNLQSDTNRITKLGKFLRSSSLDELPELWNVLKGDMSLVGPRPLLMQYLKIYSPKQARRHEVRPGITGWAQINGRNTISWEEKFLLDVWYVDNHTIWLDLKIIVLTIKKVLKQDGISPKVGDLMPRFEMVTKQNKSDEK